MANNSMIVSSISGTLITGLSIYFVLSFLLIPSSITIPMSISISLLSLGLIRYYTTTEGKEYNTQSGNNDSIDETGNIDDGYETKISEYKSIIIFVALFLASLIICTFFSDPEVGSIFTSWNTIDAIGIIGLGAGIAISFFMPGYAVILLLTRRFKINPVLKILLAYLFSMLITGLTVYLTEIFLENDISENKNLLLGVNVVLLIAVVTYYRAHKIILAPSSYRLQTISIIRNKVRFLKRYSSEILVFGSLLSLLIISTNYLYGGITIGDQWYHQNRIILFMTGQFKEFVLSNGDEIYPPLQSALLAGLTTLSGIPLVNTFASIAFLNISAVFAFYYFCSIWLPGDNKRAALFASFLFLIAAGFGWIYIISLAEANPLDSQIASIANFVQDKIKVSDIRLSANFMIAAFPDFSTGLIYIALPAGFLLLGLVRNKFANRFQYILILSLVTTLGILSHDEFYIFIIIASTLPLIYNIEKKYSVYISLIIALAFTFSLNTLLPVKYFTIQSIFGVSLLYLVTVFSLLMMGLYTLRQNLYKLRHSFAIPFVSGMKIVNWSGKTKLIPKMIFVGIAIYLYLLCFIVWDELPANFVDVHTQKYNTPWYMYPMRLGVIGLIGLASILSYVFKRYEKEVFVFGILIVITLLAGPYYNEQRFNKYIMAGMIGFATILIFRVLRFLSEKKPILNGVIVSVIVVSASLSTLMYVGYNALVIQTQDYTHALDRRNFPSQEELHMYDILRSKIQLGPNPNNIASIANEYNLREGSIMSKLHAFTGLPYMKIAQTEYLLNASKIDLFYHLLENTNTKFLIIPTSSINNQTLGKLMKFSLDSFQQVYHDDTFNVLRIPSLRGPSTTPQAEVGILYKKDTSFLSAVQNKTQMSVTNGTFNLEKNDMKFIRINNDSQNETDNNITFYGYKKNGGKTIWSKEFDNNGINYLEFKFRINGENKTGKDLAGIKWIEGDKTYFLAVTDKGLELRQQVLKDGEYVLLSQNFEIKKNDWIWYPIKIESLENSVKVYVDNLLKMNIQKDISVIPAISKVGIFSENNAIEIEPITTGHTDTSDEDFNRGVTYGKYYPVSSLALSNSTFSTFIEDDFSALSKNFVILPFDPEYLSDIKFRTYLDYVRSGGTLIVINSGNSTGKFANFLSIENTANDTEKFTNLVKGDDHSTFLNISGVVKSITVNSSSDLKVVASYFDEKTKHSSPFVVERNLTNNGH
ncbi:MAG TPA: hypothetical protein VJS91_06090, partial [Nitrososphaeraceae archaeon]|nr:hypothetical protein [Nitrososphaeraceae archaeon]